MTTLENLRFQDTFKSNSLEKSFGSWHRCRGKTKRTGVQYQHFCRWGNNNSDSDEDETVAEMERESESSSKKTKEQALIDLITEQTKGILNNTDSSPAGGREVTEDEKRAAMLKGIKAAEEADNRLTEELFGGASASALKEEESKFEDVVETISRVNLSTEDHYKRLGRALSNKIPSEVENAAPAFVEVLVKELVIGDACEKIDTINARLTDLLTKKKAEAAKKAEKPKAEKVEAPKKDNFDMMTMMDNMSEGEDDYDDDEDGYDFM